MKTKNKVVLIIELVLIIAGLVLAGIGGVNSLKDLPGKTVPEVTAPAEGMLNPAEAPAEGTVAPAEGEVPPAAPAEGVAPTEGAVPAEGAAPAEGAVPPADGQVAITPPADSATQLGTDEYHSAGTVFSYIIVHVVPVLVYIMLLVYVLVEFRKPHGNLLRVTMLMFSFMLAIWAIAQGENAGCTYILPCAAVIAAYLSGRLNKIKKNIAWIIVAALLLIGYGVLQMNIVNDTCLGALQISHCFGALLQWITLALAYFSRYNEHKAAGQEETAAE